MCNGDGIVKHGNGNLFTWYERCNGCECCDRMKEVDRADAMMDDIKHHGPDSPYWKGE